MEVGLDLGEVGRLLVFDVYVCYLAVIVFHHSTHDDAHFVNSVISVGCMLLVER